MKKHWTTFYRSTMLCITPSCTHTSVILLLMHCFKTMLKTNDYFEVLTLSLFETLVSNQHSCKQVPFCHTYESNALYQVALSSRLPPDIWMMSILPSMTFSRAKKCFTSICFVRQWNSGFWASLTAALLSITWRTGLCFNFSTPQNSRSSQITPLAASVAAIGWVMHKWDTEWCIVQQCSPYLLLRQNVCQTLKFQPTANLEATKVGQNVFHCGPNKL